MKLTKETENLVPKVIDKKNKKQSGTSLLGSIKKNTKRINWN